MSRRGYALPALGAPSRGKEIHMDANTRLIFAAIIGFFGGGVWTLDILLIMNKI